MPDKPVWVLVGGETLLGRDVREVVAERKLPVTLRLCSTEPEEGILTAGEDEPLVMEPLSPEALESAQALLLAGSAASHRRALEMLGGLEPAPAIIDLAGHLEDLPAARLRAPLLESTGAPGSLSVIAHPAATTLARFIEMLHRLAPVRQSSATILEPVSAQDRAGVDEMHKQTVSLLSFQSMPQAVYDTQVTFNLLPSYGDASPVNLEEAELRVERHLTSLLAPLGVPLPSIYLVHAPVFHGYCLSVRVEFEATAPLKEIEDMLRQAGVEVRAAGMEPPSNLAVAGQSGFTVGGIRADRNNPSAAWFWLAADNLRTTAENAVMVAGLAVRGGR